MVQEEVSILDNSYLEPSSSMEQSRLGIFGRQHYEEHYNKIILNMDQWLNRCDLNIYHLELCWSSCSGNGTIKAF